MKKAVRKPKLGTGERFAALEKNLGARRGKGKVKDTGALAAYIGVKKWGQEKMTKMAVAGRKRAK